MPQPQPPARKDGAQPQQQKQPQPPPSGGGKGADSALKYLREWEQSRAAGLPPEEPRPE